MTKPPIRKVRHETATRLCLRPERIPGVAPPYEDDRLDDVWRRNARNLGHMPAPVTLPRLAFLEGRGDE